VIGRKGASLRTSMQAMEKCCAKDNVCIDLDQPNNVLEITGTQSTWCYVVLCAAV
jgi:hypothetical protein